MSELKNTRIPLANGLILTITDRTRRYFGDYFTVRLDIDCPIAVDRAFFPDEESFQRASALLRKPLRYSRTLQRSGIASAEVETVREELLRHFRENSLAYLSSPLFIRKLIEAEVRKISAPESRLR